MVRVRHAEGTTIEVNERILYKHSRILCIVSSILKLSNNLSEMKIIITPRIPFSLFFLHVLQDDLLDLNEWEMINSLDSNGK